MKKLFKLLISIALVFGFLNYSNVIPNHLIDDVISFASTVFDERTTAKELEKSEVIIDHVVDGDTISVIMPNGKEESVRLLLIDTPESVHPTKPDQKFGVKASAFAKETLKKGQEVMLEVGDPKRDKYDRLLAYIWIDNINFNQLMIEKGFARVAYVYEPNTKYIKQFRETEQKAKKREKRIWSIPGYVKSEFEI